jgi:hypothetical protein
VKSRGILTVVAAVAIGAIAASLLRAGAGRPAYANGDGQPIMTIVDERKACAKEAEPTIYVLWPGRKKVEAFASGSMTFTTYDFATRTVTFDQADIK